MSKVTKGQHPILFYRFDLASELDPAFLALYTSGANLLTVVRGDAIGAEKLLLKGHDFIHQKLHTYPDTFRNRFWTKAWNIPMLLGYIYLFELDNLPEAARYFREAGSMPGVPAYLTGLAERLSKQGGEYEVGLRLLAAMANMASDEKVKKGLENKRKSLFVSHYLFELNNSFTAFLNGLAGYKKSMNISMSKMRAYFDGFIKAHNSSFFDPFGGKLFLDRSGRIQSSTPRGRVLGLE